MRSLKTGLRFVTAGALLIGALGTMTGCGKENKSAESTATPVVTEQNLAEGSESSSATAIETEELQFDSNVIKVGSEQVTYREVLIYLLQLKNKYEPTAGSEIWDRKVSDTETFGDQAKQELIDEITELKVIKQQAKQLDIELSSDETLEVSASVKEYMGNITKEDQEKYGITEEMVQKVLEENYLAQKVYNIATNEVDTNISDDEAKQIKVEMLEVMTNGTDKDGTKIELDKDQKKDAKKRAEQLRKQATKEEDFAGFATANTDASKVDLTFGKGDYPQLEEAAFALKQGEISKVIETDEGYVILKLISAFDEEATNAKKESIIEQAQNKLFAEKYKAWSGEYKVTQDTSKWNAITFHI